MEKATNRLSMVDMIAATTAAISIALARGLRASRATVKNTLLPVMP